MIRIAKAAALVAVAAAAFTVAMRMRAAPPSTTIVVERAAPDAWLPQRMVRITAQEIVYQGTVIARVPVCTDSPCFKVDALYEELEATQPPVPRGAFEPARLVLVDVAAQADGTTELQVLNAISAAGYWPVVTVAGL